MLHSIPTQPVLEHQCQDTLVLAPHTLHLLSTRVLQKALSHTLYAPRYGVVTLRFPLVTKSCVSFFELRYKNFVHVAYTVTSRFAEVTKRYKKVQKSTKSCVSFFELRYFLLQNVTTIFYCIAFFNFIINLLDCLDVVLKYSLLCHPQISFSTWPLSQLPPPVLLLLQQLPMLLLLLEQLPMLLLLQQVPMLLPLTPRSSPNRTLVYRDFS